MYKYVYNFNVDPKKGKEAICGCPEIEKGDFTEGAVFRGQSGRLFFTSNPEDSESCCIILIAPETLISTNMSKEGLEGECILTKTDDIAVIQIRDNDVVYAFSEGCQAVTVYSATFGGGQKLLEEIDRDYESVPFGFEWANGKYMVTENIYQI